MKIELMAADDEEGNEWLRRRVPKKIDLTGQEQIVFERRSIATSAGVFRVKRVMGF